MCMHLKTALLYMNQKLTNSRGKLAIFCLQQETLTPTAQQFTELLDQKPVKIEGDLSNTTNYLGLIDIYRALYSTKAEHTFFVLPPMQTVCWAIR